MSLNLHVDALVSTGYIEGWAHYPARPGSVVELAVISREREIGRGLANGYRWDLANAGIGLGWCAFRIRVSGGVSTLRRSPLVIVDTMQSVPITWNDPIPVMEENEICPSTLDEVLCSDPTIIRSIDQLRGCDSLFDHYMRTKGVESFVRAAYVYILSRPADSAGLNIYSTLLRNNALTAFAVLNVLYDSDEFRAIPRQLCAPTEPGFIFSAL